MQGAVIVTICDVGRGKKNICSVSIYLVWLCFLFSQFLLIPHTGYPNILSGKFCVLFSIVVGWSIRCIVLCHSVSVPTGVLCHLISFYFICCNGDIVVLFSTNNSASVL